MNFGAKLLHFTITVYVCFLLYASMSTGTSFGTLGGSSDSLLSSGSSKPIGAVSTTIPVSTSSYVPSRLDSALSSTYHPLLGASPIPPIASSSSSTPSSGSLSMFLGQHQPGFPSSSIKVHPRSPAAASAPSSQQQSVGSKLASSEWPDLGVSITSKSAPGQWLPATTDSTNSSTTKGMCLRVKVESCLLSLKWFKCLSSLFGMTSRSQELYLPTIISVTHCR